MLDIATLQARMQEKGSFYWLVNLSLVLLIFIAAELGRALGIYGDVLRISVVWPAAGIALAAILLFGFDVCWSIFLGNLIYNLVHFFLYSEHWYSALLPSTIIAAGSLLQAYLGGYIMHRFSTATYFNTVKDIFIFLLPASLLASMIASSLGILTLYLMGYMSNSNDSLLIIWTTFWLGDSMGVYLFTPLLVVWLTHPIAVKLWKYHWEALIMALSFLLLCLLTLVWSYPFVHVFIPLSLWITYRYRMHGATIAIALFSLATIAATAFGYGAFVAYDLPTPLLTLVSFLEMIIITCLIFAAVLYERQIAWQILSNHNIDLQHTLDMQKLALKEMHDAVSIKDKQATFGTITMGISKQIQKPLDKIVNYAKISADCAEKLHSFFRSKQAKQVKEEELKAQENIEMNFEALESALKGIRKYEMQTHRIIDVIQEQMKLADPESMRVTAIDVQMLLNTCLIEVLEHFTKKNPSFNLHVIKDYDKNVSQIVGLPYELSLAFTNLIDNALNSLHAKKELTTNDDKELTTNDKKELSTNDNKELSTNDNKELSTNDNKELSTNDDKELSTNDDKELSTNDDKESPSDAFVPTLELHTVDHRDKIVIVIRDNGVGVAKNKLDHYFQSFLDNDAVEDGCGLELALTHDIIVHLHHGTLFILSQESQYSEVHVSLPKTLANKIPAASPS